MLSNITWIGNPVAKLWPLLYYPRRPPGAILGVYNSKVAPLERSLKATHQNQTTGVMLFKQESPADARVTRDSAIIPRWPSAAILDIIKPQIAPFDPPTPKTLAQNQTCWSGSDAPFARYSPLNYTVTLKLGFGVTQGHRKRHHYISRPRKPDPRSKHDVAWHNDCEVVAFFVCPRWPSAAILDFIKPQLEPFDPPTPKTVSQSQTWSGLDAPFARYSPLNYTVTLKLGFGVTQGNREWHHSIEHMRLYIRLPQ